MFDACVTEALLRSQLANKLIVDDRRPSGVNPTVVSLAKQKRLLSIHMAAREIDSPESMRFITTLIGVIGIGIKRTGVY